MLGASMFPVIFMMSLLLAAVSATGAEAAHGMVASVHPLATDAGVRVLKEGGYEAGEATVWGSLPGPFAKSTEERIVGKVRDLAGAK